jgi:4a-hydroxytetrahydrobiopterin dehydratase
MNDLAGMRCARVRRGDPPASEEEIKAGLAQLPGWSVIEQGGIRKLEKSFKFKDFREALAFTNEVGALAEEQDHHPLIVTEWGRVTVQWWTHVVGGLHLNDLIMAAKTDRVTI